MEFSVKYLDRRNTGQSQYIESEYSLYYEPWNNVDSSIQIGTGNASLDVNTYDMRVLQVSGYLPKAKWIEMRLSPPKSRLGELMIKDGCSCISPGIGVDYARDWDTFFDARSGWMCMGSPTHDTTMDIVEFAHETVAVVKDSLLQAIWIRPQFV